jgi:inner membrane protein
LDNLTHSLVGAVLGRAGLKRLTPYAMPALIISANLPDIDSWIARPLGMEPIAFHRGFTHGVGGLATLPFLVAAMFLMLERLHPSKGGPVRFWPLLLVCFAGGLSHSILDLMNSYGIRLLEPFSPERFYEDSWYIVDPTIWLILILGLEFSWRAERLGRDWTMPALVSLSALVGYGAINFAISKHSEALTRTELASRGIEPTLVVANPRLLTFWRRHMLWRNDEIHGDGWYGPRAGLVLEPRIARNNLDDPRLPAAARRDPHVRAFLFWSRMPIVLYQGSRAYLSDQRFPSLRTRTPFIIPLDNTRPSS